MVAQCTCCTATREGWDRGSQVRSDTDRGAGRMPVVAANLDRSGPQLQSMTAAGRLHVFQVIMLMATRIKHGGGGTDFFFWTNGKNMKFGDKVKFQFAPNAPLRLSYHRRKAIFCHCVAESVPGRSGCYYLQR